MSVILEHPWSWDDIPPLDDQDAPSPNGQHPRSKGHAERVEHHADELRARREARRLVDEEESGLTPVQFETVTATEFLTIEFPADPTVIDRFVVEGGNTLVVAPKKTGKTTLAGNLGRSLVEGVPFLGALACSKPRRSYLMNLEMSDPMLQGWLTDIGIHPDARDRLVVSRNLRGRSIALTNTTVRKEIAKQLAGDGIEVWLIDCMRPLIAACGFSENDNAEISRLLLYVDEIKHEAGCHTSVGFHHAGKGEVEDGRESGRGASAWGDWPDVSVYLTKDKANVRYMRTEGRLDDIPESRLDYSYPTRRLTLAGEGESRQDTRLNTAVAAVTEAVHETPGINKSG